MACERLLPKFIDQILDLRFSDLTGTSKFTYEERVQQCNYGDSFVMEIVENTAKSLFRNDGYSVSGTFKGYQNYGMGKR